jgi:MFS family permease
MLSCASLSVSSSGLNGPGVPDPSDTSGHLQTLRRALAEPGRYVRAWYLAYLLLGIVTAGMIPVLLPLMMASVSGHLSTVAYVMGAYNLGLLSSPLWGLLAERRKIYRTLFFAGFVVVGAATALMPFLRGISTWMPAAFAMGLGSAGVATVASLFIVDFTPSSDWEPSIGYLQSFNGTGQVVGLLLSGLFTAGLFSRGLWVAAALVVPAVAVGHIGLPAGAEVHEPDPKRARIHEHLNIRALAAFPRLHFLSGIGYHFHPFTHSGLRRLPDAVRTPFGRFILSWFMMALGVAAFFAYFPVMLASGYGISASLSSLIYAMGAGVGIALFVLASRWAGRYGSGSVYQLGLWIRLVGFVLLLVPLVGASTGAFLLATVGFVLIVLSWPLLSVAGTGLAARLAPFSEGAAMGLFNAALASATVLGTFASGPLLHRYGFGVVPVMALAGVVASIALGTRLPASQATPQAPPRD